MILNVELVTGDVNKIKDLNFLLIGHKNPLRKEICRETNSVFKLIDSEPSDFPHQYELLEDLSYKWKSIAAIKFRSNRKLSRTQIFRIKSPITTALKADTQIVGILPPTWRNPDYSALGIVYSLWSIACAYQTASESNLPNDMVVKLFPDPSNVKFEIISVTGIEYFEQVLRNDCELMWNFIQKLYAQEKKIAIYELIKENYIKFNVTNRSI